MAICVIFNPTARGDKAVRFRQQLEAWGAQCTLKPTTGPGAARPLAAEAVREGFTTIAAAGGDGTVNEVLNGLGDVPEGFARARLAVLPLGTVNVFAKELGVPLALGRAWKTLLAGRETLIDLPLAEFVVDGLTVRRYFAQLAGAGLDSQAIDLVDWGLKKKFGPLAYVMAGVQALRGHQPTITVTAGGQSCQGELVLAGNGKYYGGRLKLFPEAELTDGQVDLAVFPTVNAQMILRAGLGLASGRLNQFCGAMAVQSSSVQLSSTERVLLQLDGDNVGELPATLSILPRRLRVVVP